MENLLGKRVQVRVPLRSNNFPCNPTNRFTTVVGVCNFIGVNELHGNFQVTIGRTPIWYEGFTLSDVTLVV